MLESLKIQVKYLRRARRATIRLLPNGSVNVSVPYGIPESEINRILKEKSNWILKKIKMLEAAPKINVIRYISGEALPFCGRTLILNVVNGRGETIEQDGKLNVFVSLAAENYESKVRSSVLRWYKEQAIEVIEKRVAHYCNLFGAFPKSIAIKNYRSRWGACSSKGDLIFNWQIMTFSPRQLDYVVAHEICHLKEMNHSKRFYEHLKKLGFDRREIHPQMKYLRNVFK